MLLHSSNETALVKDLGFSVAPGTHTLVAVDKEEVYWPELIFFILFNFKLLMHNRRAKKINLPDSWYCRLKACSLLMGIVYVQRIPGQTVSLFVALGKSLKDVAAEKRTCQMWMMVNKKKIICYWLIDVFCQNDSWMFCYRAW